MSFGAIEVDTNKDRNISRKRPRASDAYNGPINRLVPVDRRIHVSSDGSEVEDEFLPIIR